jgi:hypothetical protein
VRRAPGSREPRRGRGHGRRGRGAAGPGEVWGPRECEARPSVGARGGAGEPPGARASVGGGGRRVTGGAGARPRGAGEPPGERGAGARDGPRKGARREEERGGGRERRERGGDLTSGSKSSDHRLQNLGYNGEKRERELCAGELNE